MTRPMRAIPWIIFLLAFGVRTLYVFQIDDSPLFDHPPVDGLTYVQHAARLAAGNWLGFGEPAFWQPPLYPYLLGLHQVLSSEQIFHSLRFFQILCGSLTCVLIWFVGRRLFPNEPMVAAVAALAGSLYGTLIFFDGEVLPATLATFLDLVGLLLLLRCQERRSAARYLLAGIVFGLAALTVATVLTFVLAAAAFIWIETGWQYTLAQRLRWPLAFLVGVALVIVPVTLRNTLIGGDRRELLRPAAEVIEPKIRVLLRKESHHRTIRVVDVYRRIRHALERSGHLVFLDHPSAYLTIGQ